MRTFDHHYHSIVAGIVMTMGVFAAGCGDDGSINDPGSPDAAVNVNDAAAPAVTYAAAALIGGLDRIVISRHDATDDVCVVLRLVSPTIAGPFDIITPANWDAEYAYVYYSDVCHGVPELPSDPIYATSGTGSVTWDAGAGLYPETITSLDVTLYFASGLDGTPENYTLVAADLPVTP